MITELDILNFQSHEETHLSFHPGVNIFVGSSDSGKTEQTMRCVWQKIKIHQIMIYKLHLIGLDK